MSRTGGQLTVLRERERERPEPGPNVLVRALRALSGLAAAGLVVLTGVMAVAAWLTDRDGAPGPGADTVLGHLAVAMLAVGGQIVADRSDDRPLRAVLAVLAVLGLAATALWVWWWN